MNGAVFGQVQDFIPIDHKGEPPSSHIGFLPNRGQLTALQGGLVPDIKYYSIQARPQMFFSKKNEVYFTLGARDTSASTPDTLYRIGMKFVGENVNLNCSPSTYEPLDGFYNFILGHCPNGIFEVQASRRIVYPNMYPGIDFHVYSNPWGVKFYLVMNTGSSPEDIKMQFQGQDSLSLDLYGQLKAYLSDKTLTLPKGLCYQQIGGTTTLVNAALNYALYPGTAFVGFQFDTYNPYYPLIIDISASLGPMGGGTQQEPEWCTFYGNTELDAANDAVTLPEGGLMVCGTTYSPQFPLFNEQDDNFEGGAEAYYSEFNADYHRVYTTFFGGSGGEGAESMALTADGNSVYVFGRSSSPNLPVLQYGSGFYDTSNEGTNGRNCYIARFSRVSIPIGQRELVTYFGDGIWKCNCLRTDALDNVHVLGTTDPFVEPDLDLTCQGSNGTFPSCNPAGSTDFFQGSVGGGADAFYARFDANLNLKHSTFFGGSATEHGRDLVVDNSTGRIYFTGNTASVRVGTPNCLATNGAGFPLCNMPGSYYQSNLNGTNTSGLNDAYIACLGADGALLWSTFVGSTDDETGQRMGRNLNGDLYISGLTSATTYSTTSCLPPTGSGLPNCASGSQVHYPHSAAINDNYIIKFDGATHALAWSTFIDASVNSFLPDEGGNMTLALTTYGGSGGTAPIPVLQRPNTYFQPEHADTGGSGTDAMVMAFNPADELVLSSYFGGSGSDYAAKALPWSGGRLYLVGHSFASETIPFHCPPTIQPYCYLTYDTQSPSTGEALYAQLQYDVTIGVGEGAPSALEDVLLYPNPTTSSLFIQLPAAWTRAGPPFVDIYDATGSLLEQQPLSSAGNNGVFVCDLRGAGTGLRFMRLRSRDGAWDTTRAIVVQ